MKSRHFLIPALLSVAGLLMLSDFAHAQRGRGAVGGGRGAVVVGGGGRGAVVVGGGGFRGGPYYGYGYRGYGYGGYGYGWGYPYYGFGLGIGLGGYAPIYGYAFDAYGASGVSMYPPVTGVPAAQGAPAMAQEGLPAGSASIRLILPDPNAVVFFDGNKTNQTGSERMFHTPPLAAGASSSYRIRAVVRQGGKDLVLEQVVPVSPGQNITVDFTRPHSEGIAPPEAK